MRGVGCRGDDADEVLHDNVRLREPRLEPVVPLLVAAISAAARDVEDLTRRDGAHRAQPRISQRVGRGLPVVARVQPDVGVLGRVEEGGEVGDGAPRVGVSNGCVQRRAQSHRSPETSRKSRALTAEVDVESNLIIAANRYSLPHLMLPSTRDARLSQRCQVPHCSKMLETDAESSDPFAELN